MDRRRGALMEDSDLVPTSELVVPEQTRRELDQYVDKLSDYKECQRMVEFWNKRLDRLKSELAAVMGDATVGTVNGEGVLFYAWKEQFRGADFRRDYPDMYKLYTHDVAVNKFDEEWLRASRPDLWEKYQVRSMRNTFDA
jgi:hypothetical protein